MAIDMAVLKHLAIDNRAHLSFATTHHGELKVLKYARDNSAELFENTSVEFDDVSLKVTYRLVWEVPGRCSTLTIVQRLGLNEGISKEARNLIT